MISLNPIQLNFMYVTQYYNRVVSTGFIAVIV